MAATSYGKNAAVNGWTALAKFLGAFTSVTKPPTSETAIGASLINMTGAKAAGWTNNKQVFVRKLTGAVTGLLKEGRTLYIVGEVTNGFELAYEEGGTGIKVAGHALEAASTELDLLTEVTGGTYARQSATWGTSKNGEAEDTAKEKIPIPASTTVTHIGWFEKVTVGTGKEGLQAAVKLVVPESFGSEGVFEATSDKFEGNVAE